MKCLINGTIFLSERNLAFHGTNENFSSQWNSYFLGLIELTAKYDFVLKISKMNNHYVSNSQNEIISLIMKRNFVKQSFWFTMWKYYSIILDCTLDSFWKMSVILRNVHCKHGEVVMICESFFNFLTVDNMTRKG